MKYLALREMQCGWMDKVIGHFITLFHAHKWASFLRKTVQLKMGAVARKEAWHLCLGAAGAERSGAAERRAGRCHELPAEYQ